MQKNYIKLFIAGSFLSISTMFIETLPSVLPVITTCFGFLLIVCYACYVQSLKQYSKPKQDNKRKLITHAIFIIIVLLHTDLMTCSFWIIKSKHKISLPTKLNSYISHHTPLNQHIFCSKKIKPNSGKGILGQHLVTHNTLYLYVNINPLSIYV